MTNWTDEDALRLDIAMALSKIKTKPRGDRDGVYRKMVAEQIVDAFEALQLAVHQGAAATAPRTAPQGAGLVDGRRLWPAPFLAHVAACPRTILVVVSCVGGAPRLEVEMLAKRHAFAGLRRQLSCFPLRVTFRTPSRRPRQIALLRPPQTTAMIGIGVGSGFLGSPA